MEKLSVTAKKWETSERKGISLEICLADNAELSDIKLFDSIIKQFKGEKDVSSVYDVDGIKGNDGSLFNTTIASVCSCNSDYGCCKCGNHAYAEKTCNCGHIFCYSCCESTNVDQGGKYNPDYMTCPKCNFDYYPV